MQIKLKKRIANLISNIVNPYLVGLIIIMMLSFASTSTTRDALKWALIMLAVSLLPIFLVTIYLAASGQISGLFASVRRQRTKIYLPATACGILGCFLLLYLDAPKPLLAVFITGLASTVIFMVINLWWKISLHSAFAAAAVTVLVILYGWIALVSAISIPVVAWSRIELKHHSLAQVTIGALLSAVIVAVVFRLSGLI